MKNIFILLSILVCGSAFSQEGDFLGVIGDDGILDTPVSQSLIESFGFVTGAHTTPYNDTAIQAEVDLNTAKTGISAQQAADITTNNAKISYTDAALVAALPTITVGTTAPSSPSVGDIWVDTN